MDRKTPRELVTKPKCINHHIAQWRTEGALPNLHGMHPNPTLEELPISHHFGGGVYAKETRIAAGLILVQHKHEHDHLSVLASGTVALLIDGVRSEMTGPACITITAGKHHGVKALTDVVWYCIHATDCTQASEVDEVLIASPDDAQMASMVRALQ